MINNVFVFSYNINKSNHHLIFLFDRNSLVLPDRGLKAVRYCVVQFIFFQQYADAVNCVQ